MDHEAVGSNFQSPTRDAGVRALESAFIDCESRNGRPATSLEICEELGIPLQTLFGLLEGCRELNLGKIEEIQPQEGEGRKDLVKYMPYGQDESIFYVYARSEFRRSLTRAVEALPKNEQLVFLLRYRQRLSMADIAGIVGFSETRVAQIHTTAMLRIRPKLLGLEACSPGAAVSSAHANSAA